MALSQNGYEVLFDGRTDGPLPRLRRFVIPGTGAFYCLRDGSAGFLLAHAILYWHERVEPINVGPPDPGAGPSVRSAVRKRAKATTPLAAQPM